MSEGRGNADVPQFLLSCDFFDLLVYGVGGWHNQCSEVFCLKDDDVVIVLPSLVVVVASGKKIGLFVQDTGFVTEHEVVFG